MTAARAPAPLLSMTGIVRRYGTVRANDGIDLIVQTGEILGLLGENGSGKSTLMKVLFGMTPADAGEIAVRGRALAGHRPSDAMAAGIAMIHQHFMLVEAMTVVENVMLGWPAAGRVLRRAEMAARIREASRRFGLDLDPEARVADLPLGRRQRVEILKAVLREAELLVLDEPTSNLAPVEVAELLGVLRRLRGEGKGVVFITHKLPEVMEVCDRVVVLRGGRVAGAAPIAAVTPAELAEMMVGRDVTAPHVARTRPPGEVRLAVAGLAGPGLGPLTFEVRGGEVLGIAGVDGNGQIELVETLAGLRRAAAGSIALDGRELASASVAARVRAGMAYMPADRAATGLVRSLSIADNLMLRDSTRPPYARGAFLAPGRLQARARALMRDYDIRAPGPRVPAARLSGGNQQKIVVARELDRRPALLVAHQAAWGLDPGATRFVLERVLGLRDEGAAIVYVSSELDEVLDIADRVAVMADGGFAGVTAQGRADLARIGLWMSGRAA
ncbi:ABC transporter ATP-binding protein [Labrys wisconsinensis]|uniref:Simple sugar transport system ATP-binding protein n=1 Tax=Labrys wisconsinensis TaxID=425677 RepID=A0ABU0JCL2_9HYPH|nr:ABC transporter ATP-binding protein [Labrys wisconsinensis]MDQ0472027.1 simple sugar transport system ATP-binding protein [Labrys wisconsinensis]